MLKNWKLQQVLVHSLAIIVWVNNFQTPEIQAVLSIFIRDGNEIAAGSNRGGEWGVECGLNIGVKMEYEDNWKPEVQFGALLDLPCAHSTPNWS